MQVFLWDKLMLKEPIIKKASANGGCLQLTKKL